MKKTLLIILYLITFNSCVQSKKESNNLTHENSKLAARVDNYLKSVTSLGFSGSIIVSEGSEIILQKGYGLANRENRTEYLSNTIQSCGSITKQFTASAILLLESKNRLSVNDKLSEYFSNAPKEYQNITIHQLLTHSSGIISGIGPDEEPISKEAFLKKLWLEALEFEPGSGYRYSNAGYSLLGMIIEQVSKMNYEDFLRENLFDPSKMESTGYMVAGKDTTQLAIGYNKGKYWGKVYKNGWLEDGPNWHLRANGGIHTTVEDMHKWLQVMLGNGVLEDDIIEKWTTGYVNENNDDSKYAYGLVVYNDQKYGKIITHAGSNRIFSADLVWLPEKNILYYIQSNTSLFPAYEISNNILSAAFDSTFRSSPFIKIDDNIKPESILQLEGKYEIDGGSVELKSDDVRLMAKINGQSMLNLFLNHSTKQQDFFSNLNQRTNEALILLKEGRADALKDLMPAGQDPLPATENLLRQIDQIGNLEYLNLIGTFENSENSRFSKIGAYTTFVHARFPNWNRYWNFVFDKDGKYVGTYSGPWPTFTMIPVELDKFIAVRQEFPYETTDVVFKEDCLILNGIKACIKE
ncbi:serine hydrolase domain-containing protein [Xanthovirga aplysinae]|uniref:serine hydrolase domain-containing protein n=1 Tax=Xanthovirga aplysinae TaxID=2529853 RepID=UPI001CA3F42A|nr:serine hydrolase domain-containing protein [Xanthovirga aplysinae]